MIDAGIGTYETETLDSILAGVKMRLKVRDNTSDDLLIKDLIVEGLKKSRVPQLFIRKIAFLDINTETFSAKLPCGFVRFDHYNPIRFVGNDGLTDVDNHFFAPEFINNTFFKCDPSKNYRYGFHGSVTQVGDILYFSSNISATRCEISYLSENTDENGEIIIPEIMGSVLIAYACWQWGTINYDRMPQDVRRSWEVQYRTNKRAVKGIQNLPSALESKLIQWIQNSIL